jgi:hypothetical protein
MLPSASILLQATRKGRLEGSSQTPNPMETWGRPCAPPWPLPQMEMHPYWLQYLVEPIFPQLHGMNFFLFLFLIKMARQAAIYKMNPSPPDFLRLLAMTALKSSSWVDFMEVMTSTLWRSWEFGNL